MIRFAFQPFQREENGAFLKKKGKSVNVHGWNDGHNQWPLFVIHEEMVPVTVLAGIGSVVKKTFEKMGLDP